MCHTEMKMVWHAFRHEITGRAALNQHRDTAIDRRSYVSCVIHLSGMVMKYRSMASEKRLRYCGGWMIVGSAWPAIMPTDLPMRSIRLMMSYCNQTVGKGQILAKSQV